jgi:hypothetical protein
MKRIQNTLQKELTCLLQALSQIHWKGKVLTTKPARNDVGFRTPKENRSTAQEFQQKT